MKKKLIFRITLFIIYLYIFSFYAEKIIFKLPDWIAVPTTALGIVILTALLIFAVDTIMKKLL